MGGLTPSPSTGVVTAAEVWAYASRVLTSSLDPTAAQIWASVARTLTDPNSYKADVSALALEATLGGKLGTTHFDISEFEVAQVPATENTAVAIAVTTADQSLGSKNITVDIPAGASIISVIALARISILNDTATAQKIDLKFEVEGTVLFSQTDIVGFGAVDGASTVYTIAEDASDEVTADAQVVTLEAKATLSSANSVRFQAQYFLFIKYKMG